MFQNPDLRRRVSLVHGQAAHEECDESPEQFEAKMRKIVKDHYLFTGHEALESMSREQLMTLFAFQRYANQKPKSACCCWHEQRQIRKVLCVSEVCPKIQSRVCLLGLACAETSSHYGVHVLELSRLPRASRAQLQRFAVMGNYCCHVVVEDHHTETFASQA